MTEDNTDTTHQTVKKTLWSETLIELLLAALNKKQSDNQIIEILKELKEKNFKASYITSKVRKSHGESEAARVKSLIKRV